MPARFAIADAAALIGEPTRAAMLIALVDGRALPAGELAREANLSAAATSLHLSKLMQGGFVVVHQEGRHRYYRLANGDIAHALEALGVIATAPPKARPLSPYAQRLRAARTCYDHLAGALAVAFTERLESDRMLRPSGERDYEVTTLGAKWLARELGIDVSSIPSGRRALARRCLDWTERRPHVAGALGAAILDRLFSMRWAVRSSDSRAVRVTTTGRAGFARLGIAPD